MKYFLKSYCFFFLFISFSLFGEIFIGVASCEITPPIGTPSAGYQARKETMQGIKDPLFANAMVLNNGEITLAFCSVDHLGFDRSMIQEIQKIVKKHIPKEKLYFIIGGSHTHSGGGAYLSYPIIGEAIAGAFDPQIRNFYIEQTAHAIIEASKKKQPAKIGIGYGFLEKMTVYRSTLPTKVSPNPQITLIKATTLKNEPLGLFFHFTCHPTILSAKNLRFSADFIGSTRNALGKTIDPSIVFLFFNGAQGDVNPKPQYPVEQNEDLRCDAFGKKLAEKIEEIWKNIATKENLSIHFFSLPYSFEIQPSSQGLKIPIKKYSSEINFFIFDKKHGFLTVPGELSCIYDDQLRKEVLPYLDGFSILGLVNDAHGYIVLPEAWDIKTPETTKSFGGRNYGNYFFQLARSLMLESLDEINSSKIH